MNIKNNLTELIGATPMVELSALGKKLGLSARVAAKLESFNPSGSVKARAALAMLEGARRAGKLRPGTVVVEPTSGNTGIGLAMVCAIKGYRLTLTMPESMSEERRILLAAMGAQLVLTPAAEGMKGAIQEAVRLADTLPDAFMPMQFDNPDNPDVHRRTTGPEIWRDTDGKVDIFVSVIGTGGTVTGTGQFLKEQNPDIRVVGVEPSSSPVISGGKAGPHKIQGAGAGFIPKTLDRSLLDEVLTVGDREAFEMTRQLALTEGLLAGISSGAAVQGAAELARRPENSGKTIVVILPDTGERYLSSGVF